MTVVTSDICYLSGRRLTDGRRWLTRETLDGIEILRVRGSASLHRSLAWRVFAFATFMCMSVGAALRAGPVDVVVGTSPPIFQLASAWLVAVLRRRPFVLEVRDLWPEFAVDMAVLTNPLVIWLARRIERFFYGRASLIVINSPAYEKYLTDLGVPGSKLRVVPNGADVDMWEQPPAAGSLRDRLNLNGKFVVTYAGALGRANDVPTILAAARRLHNEPDIHFLLAGGGQLRPSVERQVEDETLHNVTLLAGMPKAEMGRLLAASDACLATLLDIPMFRMTYPNKVFDYMAAGRPTVLAIDGVIRNVVEAAGGGVCVPPGDAPAIADAICYLRQHPAEARRMGRDAREYVRRHFHRDQQALQLEQALQFVANQTENSSANGPTTAAQGGYARGWKRCLDVVLAGILLIVTAPLMIVVALAVLVMLGRPILFLDRRAGLAGRPFTCWKFRTMTEARDEQGRVLSDAERLTTFGRLLRATSLDELPQVWNVLRGEMSLVGPRPLTVRYLARYTPQQARRHEVRPGITGWAQIQGRNSLSWPHKFDLDVWYVDHVSFLLDMKVLLLTLVHIVRPRGLSSGDEATMAEFLGNDSRDQTSAKENDLDSPAAANASRGPVSSLETCPSDSR